VGFLVEIKFGKGVGKVFLPDFKEAKSRLYIVSPWLSADMAKLVVAKHEEGVSVKLITTDSTEPGHIAALSELGKFVKHTSPLCWVGALVALLGLGISAYCYFFFNMGLFVSSILVFLAGLFIYGIGSGRVKYTFQSAIGEGNLLVVDQSLHAKLYIADDLVVVGSANFTISGMFHNIEAVALVKNREISDKLAKFVEEVFAERAGT
jgi:phosphatidylserine/phosphatidylglycerophosphate/cardiolipin synthase-like enzyme